VPLTPRLARHGRRDFVRLAALAAVATRVAGAAEGDSSTGRPVSQVNMMHDDVV